MPTYMFCDTTDALMGAHRDLLQASAIYVDCEGLELGTDDGRLSLITMCDATTLPPATIYIFDIYTLGSGPLRPIFDLLEAPAIRKIFYDGRMDASALYHEYGVNIVNVIDLQLAEVVSREGDDAKRIPRLASYLGGFVWAKGEHRSLYVLAGLRHSVTERRLGTKEDREESVVDHTKWLERPVAPKSLDYAAKDIQLMSLLHGHFTKEKQLTPRLAALSQRYIALGTEAPPMRGDDIFRSNALLPLGILDDYGGKKKQCQGCRRSLAKGYFASGGEYCRRCKAMTLRRPKQKTGTKQK